MSSLQPKPLILLLTLDHVSEHVQRFREALEESFRQDAVVSSVAFSGITPEVLQRETEHLLRCLHPRLLIVAFSETWSCQNACSFISAIQDHASKGKVLAVLTGPTRAYSGDLLASGAAEVVVLPDEFSALLLPRIARLFRTASPSAPTRSLQSSAFADLVGRSPSFLAVLEKVPMVASSRSTVLITGETGTGKGMIARAIHALSERATKPLVNVQCGALPKTLVENELFGHAPGAYTDGASLQGGIVQEAEGGTLFLDEVDALALPTQAKLLQLVEEKEYRPLGTSKMCRVNTRIIAASNADLEILVREKRFRGDLYYRLNVIHLSLPALKERLDDIPLLAEHFLRKHADGRGGGFSFSPGVLRALQERDWPGNVRELEHRIEGALPFAKVGELTEADLGFVPCEHRDGLASFDEARAAALERVERDLLRKALRSSGGNITQAARAVGKNRRAFWELMRKHKISGT